MSNILYLGASASGNTLYLRNAIFTRGEAWGVGFATGVVLPTGHALGVATAVGEGMLVFPVDGFADGVATVWSDNYPNGFSDGVATVTGIGGGHGRFTPYLLWPGYSSDGTDIVIPIASIPGLTAAQADSTTGDWRDILQALLLSSRTYMLGLAWSERPKTYHVFGMDQFQRTDLLRTVRTSFHTPTPIYCDVADEP